MAATNALGSGCGPKCRPGFAKSDPLTLLFELAQRACFRLLELLHARTFFRQIPGEFFNRLPNCRVQSTREFRLLTPLRQRGPEFLIKRRCQLPQICLPVARSCKERADGEVVLLPCPV